MQTPFALQQASGFAKSSALKAESKTERATNRSRARLHPSVAENAVVMAVIELSNSFVSIAEISKPYFVNFQITCGYLHLSY
jgi:hypothetical protein